MEDSLKSKRAEERDELFRKWRVRQQEDSTAVRTVNE